MTANRIIPQTMGDDRDFSSPVASLFATPDPMPAVLGILYPKFMEAVVTPLPPQRIFVSRELSRDPDEDAVYGGDLVKETDEYWEILLKDDDTPTTFPKYLRDGTKFWRRMSVRQS